MYLLIISVVLMLSVVEQIFLVSDFEMSSLEQCVNIKFFVLLEKSPFEMLKKAYENDVHEKKKKVVYECHKRLLKGHTKFH